MKPTTQKITDRQKFAAAKTAAGHKKLAVAAILLAVMAVLWVRLFVAKRVPKTAMAAADVNIVGVTSESTTPKLVYTDLPTDACRHNALANDIFSARDFKGFRRQGQSAEESEMSESDAKNPRLSGDLAAAMKEVELIAIVNDKKPQAFFNVTDTLLEKGQSFKFTFRDQVYDFNVVNIQENKVELECSGIVVTKKIPDFLENE